MVPGFATALLFIMQIKIQTVKVLNSIDDENDVVKFNPLTLSRLQAVRNLRFEKKDKIGRGLNCSQRLGSSIRQNQTTFVSCCSRLAFTKKVGIECVRFSFRLEYPKTSKSRLAAFALMRC